MKNLASILTTLIIVFILPGCEQARVDAQMEKLCEQDGGMKIYEKVMLPKEQFTPYGDVKYFQTSDVGGGYRFLTQSEQIEITRSSLDFLTWNHANLNKIMYMIIREKDNRVLGSLVMYHRIGGAIMPRLGPDPAKHCPVGVDDKTFLRAVFVQTN